MICYRCNNEAGNHDICPICGADIHVYQKVLRLSNMYYNDGLQKAEVRNLSGAIISLKRSLKFNKYNIDARNLLGLVYYEMGETVDALSEWVISKSYKQDDNVAGRYLDELRQNHTQLEAINQTIKKYNQALLYCRQDSKDLAIIQLKKVLSLNPRLVKGHQLLALLYMQEDRLEQAKRSLRNAGKIDANNTTTLRYLKEVNAKLKERNSGKKKKEEDLISYQSGNETIIMPNRFQDSSLGSTLSYMAIGLVVGILVIGFLVVPGVKSQARAEVKEELVAANDAVATSAQTIYSLEQEIEDLKGRLTEYEGENGTLPLQTVAYESLLKAYVAYVGNDYETAGVEIEKVDMNQLTEAATNTYQTVWAAVAPSYYSGIYSEAYTAFAEAKYETAIELFVKVVAYDERYKDGYASYYLAQAYNKSGNMEAARPYYQFVIDNYPGTERARTAKNYLEAE
ncbi:MAG: tetratricopeptide repeat protein [Agathobacter sp.]|nr:tetratricopeptide repeat protein [Agathobacter sp.]MBQ3030511.1 tetratricopeptide repeat protein [Agathobacter sp.]